MKMNYLIENFQSTESTGGNLLGAGKHLAKLVLAVVCHSFERDFKGTPKENLPEWADPTPQLGVTFKAKDGVISDRLNFGAYQRYDELPEDVRKSGKIALLDKNGKKVIHKLARAGEYACIVDNDGDLIRIPDEERIAKAHARISSMFNALGMEPKSGVKELMDALSKDQLPEIEIVVKETEYDGNVVHEIASFRTARKLAEAEA